jgi:CBS domain-containing protein
MPPDSPLPTRRLAAGATLAQSRPHVAPPVTRRSPATEVMTDLEAVKAATIGPGALLSQAEQTMIYQGVRMLFVVSAMPAVEGLITTTDLHGDRQMKLIAERGLRWSELTVGEVMTPFAQLDAIEHERLAHATVAQVIATLQQFGRNHLLVVDGAPQHQRVRGVISRAQIERQLGETIVLTPVASTFAELGQMLS